MPNRSNLLLSCWIVLTPFVPALAGDHTYDGQIIVDNFVDTDVACKIRINGRSLVQGKYNNEQGALVIEEINGRSEIILKGKCQSVTIKKIDGQSFLDLYDLQVGDGGITVENMNGQSRIRCWTTANIRVPFADGRSTVFYKPGAKSASGNLNGISRIVEVKP
ncbi:MAG TPA: hypothetical protein VNX28_02260 [Gemmataceae bacterium]|jgi:hypothetical protein|nr:hypothetical protein [Gemmataceae bacterium]